MNRILLFAALLPIAACRKDKPVPSVDLGYGYYPLTPGVEWVYKSDSIVFNDFTGTTDSSSFFLKETITDTFPDLEGRTSYRLERYKSRPDTNNWKLSDVWFLSKSPRRLEAVEEDIRYIRLVFPPRNGELWDVNEMNTYNELEYQLEFQPDYTHEGVLYDSVVVATSTDQGNLIEIRNHEWAFAKNVGPLRRNITELKTEVNGSIKSGYIYSQELIRFSR